MQHKFYAHAIVHFANASYQDTKHVYTKCKSAR